jgi:hypothetical protein
VSALRERLARLEDQAGPPSDPASLSSWNEFTAVLLSIPTGGILPAHLERPEQRDEAMATLFAERGFDPARMSGDDFFRACVQILDEAASGKAAGGYEPSWGFEKHLERQEDALA